MNQLIWKRERALQELHNKRTEEIVRESILAALEGSSGENYEVGNILKR